MSEVNRRRRGRPRHASAEAIHAVGFRGTGYQRSLPVYESELIIFEHHPSSEEQGYSLHA
jgi:hypothetical protein